MKRYLLLTLILFSFTSTAQAGILLEPYLGYILKGDIDETGLNAGDFSYEHNGLAYGGRIGYSNMMGPMFGFQYDKTSFETEAADGFSSAIKGEKDDFKGTNMGVFAGFSFPMMLRLWGTYHFSSELEGDDATGIYTDVGETFSGSGFSLGAGYTGLPFLSINLEYRSLEFDEYESSSGTELTLPDQSNSQGKLELSEIILSVSIPVSL